MAGVVERDMDVDDQGLFRREATAWRSAQRVGVPLLPNPFTHGVAAAAALCCLAAFVALITLLEVPRRATVRGYLAPDRGVVRVHAPSAATVTALALREGDRVAAGQVLVALRPAMEVPLVDPRRELLLRAPVAGTVTALSVQLGAAVDPLRPLLALVPEGSTLEAQLLVPSRDAGLLQPDQAVQLRLDAFPYQRFGVQRGRVRRIARSIQLPGEVHAPVAIDEPAYAVVVALEAASVRAYGREWALRAGLLLEADVILERVPLYRRLLDPLRAIGRLAG